MKIDEDLDVLRDVIDGYLTDNDDTGPRYWSYNSFSSFLDERAAAGSMTAARVKGRQDLDLICLIVDRCVARMAPDPLGGRPPVG